RRAGVPGLGLLHRVHGERADGVDGQLIEIRADGFGYWGHLVTSSSAATLLRRRRWRSAWLNSDARYVSTNSHATSGPVVRPPIHRMFMWSSSTPWCAEKWSPMRPARTPGILLAQTSAPTPLPQTAMPRSTCPAETARASGITKSG